MRKLSQAVEDRYLIEEVLRQYCRGVDRGDAALIRGVYHPDATDDHGAFKGLGVDFADRVVAAMAERVAATMHNLHQINIRFEDVDQPRRAWTESYFTAVHRVPGEAGGPVLEWFGGRYVDRFERRDGAWKIADRKVVYEWSRIETVAQEYPNDAFTHGVRGPADVSYQS